MDIILLQDIDKVGDKHTIVTVKDGYGRNYLIPQGMAIIANDTNRRRLNELMRIEEAQEAKKLSVYQDIAAKIQKVIENDDLRKELVTNGKERVKMYSWKSSVDRLLTIFES